MISMGTHINASKFRLNYSNVICLFSLSFLKIRGVDLTTRKLWKQEELNYESISSNHKNMSTCVIAEDTARGQDTQFAFGQRHHNPSKGWVVASKLAGRL